MSVDDRVRDAFAAAEEHVEVTGPLRAVHQRARAESRTRTLAGVVAAAAVAAVVGGVWLVGGTGPRSSEPVGPGSRPSSSVPASDTTSEPVRTVEDLDGRWQTREITAADVGATLARTPLERWTGEVLADLPATPWKLFLVIEDGHWRLSAETGRSPDVLLDEQAFEIDELEQVTLRPTYGDGGRTLLTHRHVTNADGLQVVDWRVISTTEPPSQGGVPAAAFLRALYETAPFVEYVEPTR